MVHMTFGKVLFTSWLARRSRPAGVLLLALTTGAVLQDASAQERRRPADTIPTLGLDQGLASLNAGPIRLELVRASQTVAALRPLAAPQTVAAPQTETQSGFDFTPADCLERRAADGYFHLGDLTLRLRWETSDGWRHFSTATTRRPVETLPAQAPVLAAANLAPTFNNILSGRTLDEAHAVASFHDPYIGRDAGYLQVTRLSGHGPTLLVVPLGDTPFEAYNPLLSDPTRRGVTFEGFYEWMAHSRAPAEDEWSEADPWNPPTSATLAPGETRSYGVKFLLADEIRAIEPTLLADGRPVAVGVPGYVVPMDIEARLFLKHAAGVRSLEVEPPGALTITPSGEPSGALAVAAADPAASGWKAYDVRGRSWGRARLTVTYEDGLEQTIHYKVIKPAGSYEVERGAYVVPLGDGPTVVVLDRVASG